MSGIVQTQVGDSEQEDIHVRTANTGVMKLYP